MIKSKLHTALISKYKSERDEALATLEVYYNNPAGIGEHPQIVEEMSKMVEKLANSQGCIEVLTTHHPD